MTNSQARLIGTAILALAGGVGSVGRVADLGVVVFAVSSLAFTVQLWMTLRPLEQKPSGPPTCAGCGYNLTGNTSGTCPECGRRIGS